MKKTIALIAAMMVSVGLFAGNNLPFISFGVKAGITSEKQHINVTNTAVSNLLNDASTGYHVGIVARVDIPLLPIYIQPELLYNWNRIKGNQIRVKTDSFSVPVMVGLGFGSSKLIKLRVNVGPVFNLTSNVSVNETTLDFLNEALRKPSVTWAAGVGIDIFGIMVDARYNGQFKKNEVSWDELPSNINTNPQSWTVSLGFIF